MCVTGAVEGPVAVAVAPDRAVPDSWTCMISAALGGGLMMLVSSTDLPTPIKGDVTLEVVCRYSAFPELEVQLAVAVASETYWAVETMV